MNLKKIMLALSIGFCSLPAMAIEKADNIGDFFTKGTYDLKLRLAYEYSDQEDDDKSRGQGLVLSSYLGYRTAELSGFSLYTQLHNLWKIEDEYQDSLQDDAKYFGENDGIADPDGTRIQQLYADLTMIPDTRIRIGRQEILLDDVRFIGNIGWRNTAQAFDAVTITNKSIQDTTIFFGYSDKVASIWFDENKYDGIYMGNIKYSGIEGHNQTAFAYLVDADEKEIAESDHYGPIVKHDTATYGVRLDGKFGNLGYDFTYANQQDWQDSEDIDVNFFQGSLSYKMGAFTPAIGYAYHEGADDSEKGFANLFSTAHKFNGWADKFLSSNFGNANGLQDYNVSLAYKSEGLGMTFKAVYHYFDTTESDGTFDDAYGSEIDLLAVKPINENLTMTAKAAFFDATTKAEDAGIQDKAVFWLRFDYKLQGKVADPFSF